MEHVIIADMNGVKATMDAEIVGDHLYVFDLLEEDGADLRHLPYSARKARLDLLESSFGPNIHVVKDAYTLAEKQSLLALVKTAGQEGIVFKRLNAPYEAGRPSSGGNQLKFKLVEDATVKVLNVKSDRRSVEMGVKVSPDDENFTPIGAVTIPPNHNIPPVGALVDVKYLYAYEGGSLFQPVYKGPRTDLDDTAANAGQLKFKVDHVEVMLHVAEAPEAPERQRGEVG